MHSKNKGNCELPPWNWSRVHLALSPLLSIGDNNSSRGMEGNPSGSCASLLSKADLKPESNAQATEVTALATKTASYAFC